MKLSRVTPFYTHSAAAELSHVVTRRGNWMRRCQETLDRWMGAAIGLVAPPRCAACGREDGPWGGIKSVMPHLCGPCQDAAAPAEGNRCRRCASPVGPFIDTRQGCMHCCRDRFHFETVIRLGIYRSTLRQICLAAKRPRSEEIVAALAEFLWKREEPALREFRAYLVIPVPHHWRENLRTTPHAPETLAVVLSRRLRVDLATHILAKTRRTDKQAKLPPSRRRTNLKGAFHVPRRFHSDVDQRRILLVDDVLTTGATADEAARALLAANASSVAVTVIARGLGKKSVPGRSG